MAKFTDGGLVAPAERNHVKNSKIDIWNRHSPVSLGVHILLPWWYWRRSGDWTV